MHCALRLECKLLITQVGSFIEGLSREEQRTSIIDGLIACAPLLEEANITLMIEPINTSTFGGIPGYYLETAAEAFEIIEKVNSDNVKILYDFYHQQITEGNIIRNILPKLHMISHFHAAGVPDHNEIYKSEIDYKYLFDKLKSAGYTGCIGLEYNAVDDYNQAFKKSLELV